MPRAAIPYDKIEDRLRKMYPYPLYRGMRIVRKSDYRGFTPIRVYDRSSGNYKAVGFKVRIEYTRFQGEYDSVMNPVYRGEEQVVIVEL